MLSPSVHLRDEGFGLEHEIVVDGHGYQIEFRLGSCPFDILGEGSQCGAEESQLESMLDVIGATSGSSGKKQLVIAMLEEDLTVRLENFLVERVTNSAIDPICTEVVHEKTDEWIGEEVLACAVGKWRKPCCIQAPAQNDGV